MSELVPDEHPLDGVIRLGARALRHESDPVAAEAWASMMLHSFDVARADAVRAGEDAPPFEAVVLERCREQASGDALLVASALAAVVPPPFDAMARAIASELRDRAAGPVRWLDSIGTAEPTRAWIVTDVFGDQESLIVGFRQPGAPADHGIITLIDHNLAGQAKDAFLSGDPEDALAMWRTETRDEPHMSVEELPVGEALRRLRAAMAMADLWDGDDDLRTDEFAAHRGLVWARLRHAGLTDMEASPIVVDEAERASLVAQFLASPEGHAARDETGAAVDMELLARHLVDLRCDDEGRPLRWSPIVVETVLLDRAPRKLLLDESHAAALPAVLRCFVRYSGAEQGLAQEFVEETLAAIDDAEGEFLKLPQPVPRPLPRQRSTADAPPELVDAAAAALVLTRFAQLVDFYGAGRKLTQNGNPTLADARALVTLLGTDDRVDTTIGDRTFKTRSAADLPELSFTIRWALAAGALRKQHNKLLATASWKKLHAKPLDRWCKAADALPTLGPLAALFADNRFRAGPQPLDEVAPELLRLLRDGDLPFDAALDWVCAEADLRYEWLSPYYADPGNRRSSHGWDLDRLVRILGSAAIVERVGATEEPDRWEPERTRTVGGTLGLTPLGRWWLGG